MKTDAPPFKCFLDEYGFLMTTKEDSIKEALRKINGVPDTSYLVNNGKVFVFKKLLRLVSERCNKNPIELPADDVVRDLVSKSYMPALEAVEQWGVIPEYIDIEVNKVQRNEFKLRHIVFNAWLPGTFHNKAELNKALANLLVGGIQQGKGDFDYQGQSMTLCEPFDIASLPSRPELPDLEGHKDVSDYHLKTTEYHSEFTPISEALFNQVKELEALWADASAYIRTYVHKHINHLWQITGTIGLEEFTSESEDVNKNDQEIIDELRRIYPELSMLSDGHFYEFYDDYQCECCMNRGWSVCRDDSFLVYLMGKTVTLEADGFTSKRMGYWLAYALLQGESKENAKAIAKEAILYGDALTPLALKIDLVMRFIQQNKPSPPLSGKAITTFIDLFRIGRKHKAEQAETTQKH